jgi:hypothetical protein
MTHISGLFVCLFVVILTFHSSDEGQRMTGRQCGIQNIVMCNNITLTEQWFGIKMPVQIGYVNKKCLNHTEAGKLLLIFYRSAPLRIFYFISFHIFHICC